MTVYKCVSKRCRSYRLEFKSADIQDQVAWTGRRVCCNHCGQVAMFVRKEENQPKVTPSDKM